MSRQHPSDDYARPRELHDLPLADAAVGRRPGGELLADGSIIDLPPTRRFATAERPDDLPDPYRPTAGLRPRPSSDC